MKLGNLYKFHGCERQCSNAGTCTGRVVINYKLTKCLAPDLCLALTIIVLWKHIRKKTTMRWCAWKTHAVVVLESFNIHRESNERWSLNTALLFKSRADTCSLAKVDRNPAEVNSSDMKKNLRWPRNELRILTPEFFSSCALNSNYSHWQ